jgi:hypothetical protein
MTNRPVCELIASSDVGHLQQIYTGFARLHRAGRVKLHQTVPDEARIDRRNPNRWTAYQFYNTKVIVNGEKTVVYDTHDWNWIDEKILAGCDHYFKRSYDPQYVSALSEAGKVSPLGLNYQVASDKFDVFTIRRSALYSGRERLKAVLKGLRVDNLLSRREAERMDNLEAPPDLSLEPRVLFMARAWDPGNIESKIQRESVEELNRSRAECILALRRELGGRFYGGLAHDDYSKRHFREALLTDPGASTKQTYLDLLKKFPICVATVGLNGSNGWKLGEYVAHSKAIISEPLLYSVPGDFARDRNYLEFSGPDVLVRSAVHLIEDRALRETMIENNYSYYRSFIRPDALVMNSLDIVLRDSAS